MKLSNAFTMIELIFVIVVLGILATVAIPKFSSTRILADISKGRSDVSAIRSSIVTERQSRLIKGESAFIAPAQLHTGGFFGGLLTYPLKASNSSGNWHTSTVNETTATINFKIDTTDVLFTYTQSNGKFMCETGDANQAQKYCSQLTD